MATLADILERIDDVNDSLTIFAEGGVNSTPQSRAVVAESGDEGPRPPEAEGLDYLLEVSVAKEVIAVWSAWRGGRAPSPIDRWRAVTYYAQYDAFLPAP